MAKTKVEIEMTVLARTNVRTMRLPVGLNPEEVAVRAKELSTVVETLATRRRELDNFLEASKGTKQSMLSDIEELHAEVNRIATAVRTESEDREVEVYDDLDFKGSAVHTRRADTDAKVGTRGMTEAERQRSLFKEAKARDEAATPEASA